MLSPFLLRVNESVIVKKIYLFTHICIPTLVGRYGMKKEKMYHENFMARIYIFNYEY